MPGGNEWVQAGWDSLEGPQGVRGKEQGCGVRRCTFLHPFPPGVVLPHTILHALGESPSVWEPVLRPATLASLLGKLQLVL